MEQYKEHILGTHNDPEPGPVRAALQRRPCG